jgi:hypothetical protein
MEPEESLQGSWDPINRPYPETDESSSYPHTLFLRSILILYHMYT